MYDVRTVVECNLGHAPPSRDRYSVDSTVSTNPAPPKNPAFSARIPFFQGLR